MTTQPKSKSKLSKAQVAALECLTEDRNRCLLDPYHSEGWCRFPRRIHLTVINSLVNRGLIDRDFELARLTDAGRAALAQNAAAKTNAGSLLSGSEG